VTWSRTTTFVGGERHAHAAPPTGAPRQRRREAWRQGRLPLADHPRVDGAHRPPGSGRPHGDSRARSREQDRPSTAFAVPHGPGGAGRFLGSTRARAGASPGTTSSPQRPHATGTGLCWRDRGLHRRRISPINALVRLFGPDPGRCLVIPSNEKAPLCPPFRDRASRTRTGDLVGVIQAAVGILCASTASPLLCATSD
jgi:hypothetical protein